MEYDSSGLDYFDPFNGSMNKRRKKIMRLTNDEKIKQIILNLEISSMRDWRLKVDSDVLRDFGVRYDNEIKSSRIRTIIRRLQNPKNKKRNRRGTYKKKLPYPRA